VLDGRAATRASRERSTVQHRLIAVVIAGRLALAPFASADQPLSSDGPIHAAATRAAAALARPAARGPMSRGLKWTGIGLLAASTLPVGLGNFGDCVPNEFSCRDQRAAAYVATGVLAGTGALLLVIGAAKRSRALPSVVWHDGRAVIQHRVTF
jgi:hypothetical protein